MSDSPTAVGAISPDDPNSFDRQFPAVADDVPRTGPNHGRPYDFLDRFGPEARGFIPTHKELAVLAAHHAERAWSVDYAADVGEPYTSGDRDIADIRWSRVLAIREIIGEDATENAIAPVRLKLHQAAAIYKASPKMPDGTAIPLSGSTRGIASFLKVAETKLADLARLGRIEPPPPLVDGEYQWSGEHVAKAAVVLGVSYPRKERW